MKLLFLFSLIAYTASCANNSAPVNFAQIEADSAIRAQPTPEPATVLLTSEQVMDAFRYAGLPIINEIVYTESSDPNSLLGRPGQYVGKVNFLDKRIEKAARDKKGCTIEVFASQSALAPRKTYLESISQRGGPGFNMFTRIITFFLG